MTKRSVYDWWVEVKFFWLDIKWSVIDFWKFYIASIPVRIRQWWYRLWIRKDEFHRSLNLDADYLMLLRGDDKDKYLKDLTRRRDIAHRRDLGEN